MSDKEFEIDELESDYGSDEEYDDNDPNVFKIRGPLPPPSASVYTTQELHQLIHEGHIDLSPPYQRGLPMFGPGPAGPRTEPGLNRSPVRRRSSPPQVQCGSVHGPANV
ncbi:hypothetical protein ACEPAI_3337 [Sanghuangporus weigelae]